MRMKDMTFEKHGKLFVLERAGTGHRGECMWLCLCDCGTEVAARGSLLRGGMVRSCGCSSRNRERIYADFGGGPVPLTDVAEIFDIPMDALRYRYYRGWSLDRIIAESPDRIIAESPDIKETR